MELVPNSQSLDWHTRIQATDPPEDGGKTTEAEARAEVDRKADEEMKSRAFLKAEVTCPSVTPPKMTPDDVGGTPWCGRLRGGGQGSSVTTRRVYLLWVGNVLRHIEKSCDPTPVLINPPIWPPHCAVAKLFAASPVGKNEFFRGKIFKIIFSQC